MTHPSHESRAPGKLTRRTLLAGTGAAAVAAAVPTRVAHAASSRQVRAGETVQPQWWGAKADSVNDDAAAINAAIQAVYDAGGGTVYLPAGTYLLGTVTPTTDHPRFATLIVPKSGVNIVGDGDATVLKTADGLSREGAAGNWNFIHPPGFFPDDPLTDVEFRNFKLDGNGENNLVDPTTGNPVGVTSKFHTVGTRYGARITVDNLTFVNNVGRQCLQFGNNVMPHSITDLVIRNCHFDTVGGAVSGNDAQTDHSSIYAQADRCLVQNNILTQPALDRSNVSTGIDVHSSNATVSGNHISNYRGGINVVATVTHHVNVTYTDNVIVGSEQQAFAFWCQNNQVMEGVRLTDNTAEQASPLPGPVPARFQVPPIVGMNVVQPIASAVIEDNTLSYVGDLDAPHMNNRGRGIAIGQCHDLQIIDNHITGTMGSAIGHLETEVPLTDDLERIEIIDNQIEDCGRDPNGDDDSHTGILFRSQRSLRVLRVEDNSIVNTGSQPTMERGIYGTAGIADGVIVDNTMVGTTTDLSWESDATIDDLHVEHTGPGSPEGIVRASVGSTYTNSDTGEDWDKEFGGTTANGWVLR